MGSGSQTIRVLSGTRDELGGVEIAIANVYERGERPGGVSAVLILEGEEKIIAAGDVLEIGVGRFCLESISKHHTGAYIFVFSQLDQQPEKPSQNEKPIAVKPIGGDALCDLLKAHSAEVLRFLGGHVQITTWEECTEQSTSKQWNGEEIGPIIEQKFSALFEEGTGLGTDAAADVTLRYIHWSPDELYRVEVSGHWRYGEARTSVFARGEKHTPINSIHFAKSAPEVVRHIVRAVAQKKG